MRGLPDIYDVIMNFLKPPKYKVGTMVEKRSGSFWEGEVVGYYSTIQTPVGYAVQLPTRNGTGPVQIYPEDALQLMEPKQLSQDQELLEQIVKEARLPSGRIRSKWVTIPSGLYSAIVMRRRFISSGSPKD